jgi:hypothetical protein
MTPSDARDRRDQCGQRLEDALAELFRETARAHHRAYADTDGYHPDWPIWYGEHMLERFNAAIDRPFTVSEVVHFLVAADRIHRREAPDAPWSSYYAHYLLSRHLPELDRP